MQEQIQAVEALVADIIASQSNYVNFHGNQTNSTIQSRQGASSSSSLLKERATEYWYEGINHQGISAFGPSGYQVFRNVKSYGAKGMLIQLQ
jgi:glucan 1,3-beta-glucosidase